MYVDGRSKLLRPTRHKLGHFGDVLPCQSISSMLKIPDPTKLTTQNQTDLN